MATELQLLRRSIARERKQKIIEAGGKQISLLLKADAVEDMQAILEQSGETQIDLFCRLLKEERERLTR